MTLHTRAQLILWLAVHGTIRGAADEPAAADTPAVDPAVALAAEIAELKEQVAESNRTAAFWADKAKGGKPAAAAAEEEDDTDVLEAITTGGTKGFDALAVKRGFIKRDEVEQLIDQRTTRVTTEQELIQQFPDLKKKDSEFFKATSLHYGDLLKQGVPQGAAMKTAASMAELDFIRSGKIKLPGGAPTKEEKEQARLDRIAAQAGGGTGARPAATSDDDDTELDANQLHIVRSMLVGQPGADGKPMNEAQAIEKYKARAKSGVAMKGQGQR